MSVEIPFTKQDADVLQEIGNVGAGHAASALSELLNKVIRISLSNARLCPFDEIANVAGGAEQVVVAVFIRLSGGIDGTMLFLLSTDSSHELLSSLLPGEGEDEEFSEMSVSALAEVANILVGAYLAAIATMTSLRIYPSVPEVAVDMAGAILDVGILPAGTISNSAILVDTLIQEDSKDFEGYCLLLPDPGSMGSLLQALGI